MSIIDKNRVRYNKNIIINEEINIKKKHLKKNTANYII